MTTHDNALKIDVLSEKLRDATIPGYWVECYPDEAEALGAFTEDALTPEEVEESAIDNPDLLPE